MTAIRSESTIVKYFVIFLLAFGVMFAQRQQAPGRSIRPSDNLKTPVSEQDVTILIHLTAEQATVVEKQRVDDFHAVVNADNSTSLVPNSPTLSDQIFKRAIVPYITQLMVAYDAPSIRAAQKAAEDAKKTADEAATKAGQVTQK